MATIFKIAHEVIRGTFEGTESFLAVENPDAAHEVVSIDGTGRFADKINCIELVEVGRLDDAEARALVAGAEPEWSKAAAAVPAQPDYSEFPPILTGAETTYAYAGWECDRHDDGWTARHPAVGNLEFPTGGAMRGYFKTQRALAV